MAFAGNAAGRWRQLDGQRRSFIRRCETYASYTLPKICTPEGYNQNSQELNHDYQAVGAQAVNHLSNKIMLALFAPSRPFFRLDASKEVIAQVLATGASEPQLSEMLAQGEKEAVKALDSMALRPKLYEAVKHLIVTGNVLLCLEKKTIRVIGLKKYCVRRSLSGQILELIIADKVLVDELDPAVQDTIRRYANYPGDRQVTLYRWITRDTNGDYRMQQWVDEYRLPKAFEGKWPEDKMPYRVMTWDLSDDAHYGTGLVEDYKGDFAALSTLSKAQVIGAVLASEFRWLVNPAGMTKPEDFENSENGSAIPGVKGDVELVQSGKASDLQIVLNTNADYVTRIGRGFLLGSAITRDAERVTAEEIRMQAQELETSLGGAYSRLAVDFQIPLAFWLLAIVGIAINGQQFKPSIVTGLEALSRNGDLEDLKQWLADLAGVTSLPPALLSRLKLEEIALDLGAGRRVKVAKYLKSGEQLAQEQAAAREAEAESMMAQAGADAAVAAANQQGTTTE